MSDLTNASIVATLFATLLSGVFLWAAIAKLRRPATTRSAFRSLRLPQAKTLTWAVPAIEVAMSVLIVIVPRIGAALIIAMLAAFTGVLLRARRWGDVRCGCFGAADTQPVTWVTFVRNLALTFAAMFVMVVAPASIVSTFTTSSSAGLIVATSAVTLAVIAAVLLALLDVHQRTGTIFGQHRPAQTPEYER